MNDPELVTLGETMATFVPETVGPHRIGASLRLTVAGAESTVAIAAARLGHRSAWVGRVGADPFGAMTLDALREQGVDISHTVVDSAAPTGLLFREERIAGRARTTYYRSGSAGSRLSPDDVDEALIRRAKVLHLTGITPALSASAAAAVDKALAVAREAGVLVSFDVNYRSALWTRSEAAAALRTLAARADILFAGLDEAQLLVGSDGGPEELATELQNAGPTEVVVTLGQEGALARAEGATWKQPAFEVRVVAAVGAGDAFVGGYLAARLDGANLTSRLELGALCGAFTAASPGDWEGLPRPGDLALLRGADITR